MLLCSIIVIVICLLIIMSIYANIYKHKAKIKFIRKYKRKSFIKNYCCNKKHLYRHRRILNTARFKSLTLPPSGWLKDKFFKDIEERYCIACGETQVLEYDTSGCQSITDPPATYWATVKKGSYQIGSGD